MTFDLKQFYSGICYNAYEYFGAHIQKNDDVEGVIFRVYAPNAKSVAVIGDFNKWNGKKHLMSRIEGGIFELFIANLHEYDLYKFLITSQNGNVYEKSDPYAFFSEKKPATASKIFDIDSYKFKDSKYLKKRSKNYDKPMSIYEVHLGSVMVKPNGEVNSYEEIAKPLISYVKSMGYTHIELMPILEHPFDGSWGYQCTGYFSATSRYGNPRQLMYFIDCCHKENIGVIIDFVPVHFVADSHGLISFDGTPLYEYSNIADKYSEWGSINFGLNKGEVSSFLLSSCAFFIEKFHVDGIRIDAVSNIIYWQGNSDIGVNVEGLNFIKRLNHHIALNYPNVMLIAEDSSSYSGITKPTFEQGLGFDYKWDLGWMNDSLSYFKQDPYRRFLKHDKVTFSMYYFYSERFLLPLSHDEVVHMKGSILNKMPGSYDQKFDNVRSLYVYQFMHPGKKLNFMGNDLAEFDEWQEFKEINWNLLDFEKHKGVNRLIRDLNFVYQSNPALYKNEYDPNNFNWIKVDNRDQSLFIFTRSYKKNKLVVVLNFTYSYYDYYEFGVPWSGSYKEIINSDKLIYGGYNNYNGQIIFTIPNGLDGHSQKVGIKIAPTSGIVLEYIIAEGD